MADDQQNNVEEKKKLIINYLPQCMTDAELMALFGSIGPIESVKIMRDHQSGYSFGYGFVTYINNYDAERAIKEITGYQIKGKTLKVSYSRPSGQELRDTNLYIQNLPKTYGENDVDDLFSAFGTIVQKSILMDKVTGIPRGVAFVRFNKKSEADAAIGALHGQLLDGSILPLNIKVAEEHGKQKAAYFAGLQTGMYKSRSRGGMMAPGHQFSMQQNQYHGGGGGGGRFPGIRPAGIIGDRRGRGRFNPMARGSGSGYSPRFPMY